jgi:serine/threonine-protein kinase
MPTADQFLDLVRRSQLVNEDLLRPFYSDQSDADHVAAALVKAVLLTQWQADKLLAGKWKGFMLGGYTLLRHLCNPGMAQEYLAEHQELKRKVVLRVAIPSRVVDATYLEGFRRDANSGELHQDGGVFFVVRAYDNEAEP